MAVVVEVVMMFVDQKRFCLIGWILCLFLLCTVFVCGGGSGDENGVPNLVNSDILFQLDVGVIVDVTNSVPDVNCSGCMFNCFGK